MIKIFFLFLSFMWHLIQNQGLLLAYFWWNPNTPHRHSYLLLAETSYKPAFTLSFSTCSLHPSHGRPLPVTPSTSNSNASLFPTSLFLLNMCTYCRDLDLLTNVTMPTLPTNWHQLILLTLSPNWTPQKRPHIISPLLSQFATVHPPPPFSPPYTIAGTTHPPFHLHWLFSFTQYPAQLPEFHPSHLDPSRHPAQTSSTRI